MQRFKKEVHTKAGKGVWGEYLEATTCDVDCLSFDSVEDLAEYTETSSSCTFKRGVYGSYERSKGSDWDGGLSGKAALKIAREGLPNLVAGALTLANSINEFNSADKPAWSPSPCGQRLSVPEYLSGNPFHMRRKTPRDINSRHVRIFVDATSSAGVSAANLITRGQAVIALIETLQTSGVSVDCFSFSCCAARSKQKESLAIVRIESRPVNISQSGFVIGHPAWGRNVLYSVGEETGFDGSWSNVLKYGIDETQATAAAKDLLDLQPGDLVIPAPRYSDLSFSNPKQWVTDRLRQVKAGSNGAEEGV